MVNSGIKLKYLVDLPITTGANKEALDFDVNKTRYIRISDFDKNGNIREDVKVSINNDDAQNYLLKNGDILVAVTGGTVGKSMIYNSTENAAYAGYLARIRVSNKLDRDFLYFAMQSPIYDRFKARSMTKSTMENISASKYANMVIPNYSLEKQKKISSFLSSKFLSIDKLIEIENKGIDFLKNYELSIINELVTKGINKNRELIDSNNENLGMIPVGWKVMRFKYACESLQKGNGISKEQVFEDGDISCVRYGEIYTKYNFYFSQCFSKTKLSCIDRPVHVRYGDILFAGTGELIEEIGKNVVYIGNEPCLSGGDIIVAKHKQDPLYLSYLLSSTQSQNQKSKGKTKLKVVHISATDIGNIFIALPPVEEQKIISQEILRKTSIIEKLIESKNKKIALLMDYKNSISYEYIEGVKEV